MFGQNPIRPVVHDASQLYVEDIFPTIQGEGPQVGRPCLFIRLAGCNLACYFCDTQFERGMQAGPQTIERIMEQVLIHPRELRQLVVMTGGEPMRQNWSTLARELLRSGTQLIQVETSGTVWQRDLDLFLSDIQFVCSPKLPSVHNEIALQCVHWKYVIRADSMDPEDNLPCYGTQPKTQFRLQRIYRPATGTIWLTPCDEGNAMRNKANLDACVAACMKHGYRLNVQLHKVIGVA